MNEPHDSIPTALAKALAWFLAWLGTVKAADVQVGVSIASGVLVGALAGVNLFLTLRDRWRGRRTRKGGGR